MINFLKYVAAFFVLVFLLTGWFLVILGLCEAVLHFPTIIVSLASVVAILIFGMMLIQFKKILFGK